MVDTVHACSQWGIHEWIMDETLNLFPDASDMGIGALCGSEWFSRSLRGEPQRAQITPHMLERIVCTGNSYCYMGVVIKRKKGYPPY